jgi:hypothetical protein
LKFSIPNGTVIPAAGFVVFYERPFLSGGFNPNGQGISPSFSLNSFLGDEVNLFSADAAGNLTGFRLRQSFGPTENSVSLGRHATTIDTSFTAMSRRTFGVDQPSSLANFRTGTGLPNALPKVGPIVISEIMYHPPDIMVGTNALDNTVDEFLELHNITDTTQTLYDPNFTTNTWRFRNGISFEFPGSVTLGPRGFLLMVNFDPVTNLTQLASFRALYGVDPAVPIYGPYGGKLGNGGETLELKKPDPPQGPSSPEFGFVPFIDADQVKYNDNLPWPTAADGGGVSLQKVVLEDYGDEPTNWVAAIPSPGRILAANTPPLLEPIASFTTNEFRPIYITNLASDADMPMQNLTFSLDPGAPAAADVSPDGVFFWHPIEVDGPGVYEFTVRVTDNGVPNLSMTQTFTVSVEEVNRQPLMYVLPQYTKAGKPLSFATAHDSDIPVNQLTFTLDPGHPAGMTIDPASGVVSWTPTDGQAPSTNWITVRVTDDGVPNLSNQRTVQVVAFPRDYTLVVAKFTKIGSIIQLSWESTVGKTYQVHYTDNLNPPVTWLSPFPAQVAAGASMVFLDLPPARRFYRVVQLD